MSVQRQYVGETGYQNGLPFVHKKILQSCHLKIIQAWLPCEIHSKIPICFHQNQIRVLLPEFGHSCEEQNCNKKNKIKFEGFWSAQKVNTAFYYSKNNYGLKAGIKIASFEGVSKALPKVNFQ